MTAAASRPRPPPPVARPLAPANLFTCQSSGNLVHFRAMGQPDLYPFALSPTVIGKLGFVHGLIRATAG